jgi:hypothetical protein
MTNRAPVGFDQRMTNWELKRRGKLTNLKEELDEEKWEDASFTPSVSPIRTKIYNKYPSELTDHYTRKVRLL